MDGGRTANTYKNWSLASPWWHTSIREIILLTVIVALLVLLGAAWRQLNAKDAAIEEYKIRVPEYDSFAESSNGPTLLPSRIHLQQ
jgi:hypothetical protein